MLSMPNGTDPWIVLHAARAFAPTELGDRQQVMVRYDQQANALVHIGVRAASKRGHWLDPEVSTAHRTDPGQFCRCERCESFKSDRWLHSEVAGSSGAFTDCPPELSRRIECSGPRKCLEIAH